jgi:hypothetical protein
MALHSYNQMLTWYLCSYVGENAISKKNHSAPLSRAAPNDVKSKKLLPN